MQTAMPDPIDDLQRQVVELKAEIAALREALNRHPVTAKWELRERGIDYYENLR